VTKRAWFGPKRYAGWGLAVYSWQGLVVTLVAIALVVASLLLVHPLAVGLVIAVVVMGAYIGIALLTGDPPGGPRRAR
jgi:hypothetical protein